MDKRVTLDQKAAHAARMRAWRKRHPDIERQRQAEGHAKHREERCAAERARKRARRAANFTCGYQSAAD